MSSFALIKAFQAGLRPEPVLTVSEWADKNRYLPQVAAAEHGRWRTSRTPYLRKIMDSLSTHYTFKKVVVMKGAQLGLTEAGNNWIGYMIDNSPAPALMVQPTDEMVKRNSKMRIDTMIQASPNLSRKVSAAKSRNGENTITQKNFPGGILLMTGANSPVGLRSVPIRNLFLDEVDGYPGNLDGEGSPIALAMARTRTFAKRKVFIISTPTIADLSPIEDEFNQTDQNYYEVPCPHCGAYQRLLFDGLKYEEDKPETTRYQCQHCGELIEERHKTAMLAAGKWIPAKPEQANADRIGFHISSLYSPFGWYSWAEAVADYMEALKKPEKMVTFTNTVLGETWAEESEAPAWENLYNRRENYAPNSVPDAVCFLTAGVDVQKDRIELEIVGWGKDKQSYSVDYRTLEGATALPDVWLELEKVLSETWTRSDGVEFAVRLMAVDSGYNTTEVYTFCRRFPVSRVIPIKGSDSLGIAIAPPKTIDVSSRGKRVGKVKIWQIGVSFLKKELYGWLGIEKGEAEDRPCYCHFPQYGENYFRGLTAEDWIPAKKQWKKRFERNEPLDCRVYARAAAVVVGLDRLKPEQIAAMVQAPLPVAAQKESQKPKKPKQKREINSIWDK